MGHTEQIRNLGLKVTGPRLKILSLFENRPDAHLSAEDVYRITIEQNLGIGVATVYRVLSQFEESGILKRHHFDTGKAVYELDQGTHHDHLVCVQCGAVLEFFDEEIEELQEKIAAKNGYEITDHSLYMYGTCKKCTETNSKKRKR